MKKVKKIFAKNVGVFILLSLTIGLAPFFPEPHLWGKLKWILGGAEAMTGMDWFDFFFHGTPWILLGVSLVLKVKNRDKDE